MSKKSRSFTATITVHARLGTLPAIDQVRWFAQELDEALIAHAWRQSEDFPLGTSFVFAESADEPTDIEQNVVFTVGTYADIRSGQIEPFIAYAKNIERFLHQKGWKQAVVFAQVRELDAAN